MIGAGWRMKRIRKQEQAGSGGGPLGAEHGRLATAIGMSTEKDTACPDGAHRHDSVLQPGAIKRGISRAGWAVRTRLPEGQVTAQNPEAGHRIGFGERGEERGPAVGTGTVCQDDSISTGMGRTMKQAAHWRVAGSFGEILWGGLAHGFHGSGAGRDGPQKCAGEL